MQNLYQHIQVFGSPGHIIVRMDNDVDTEMAFITYNAALLYVISCLTQAIRDDYPAGRRIH